MSRILVTGAGGFIGGHLVGRLVDEGHDVRAADVKPAPEWFQIHPAADNRFDCDLRLREHARASVEGVDHVYNLACDMGGMGFIETHKAACMLSVLISTHVLDEARRAGVERYFYASSACVYAADKQTEADVVALAEGDAYPAMPEDGYGWEKLFSERMCRHYFEDFGLETRVARYHNVYGPHGSWAGGREKAPAAICRKVAAAKQSGDHRITIWGDGEQTRSFMYVDDCIHGTRAIMQSDVREPINLGRSELVTINQLVSVVEEIAGIEVERRYEPDAPKGVRGRNSDNTRIRKELGWEPGIALRDGMARTYEWILGEMQAGRASVD